MLELRSLDIRRGGAHVVHDVDLNLESGGAVALVGPNGAGKSTLLLAIAGLLRPTRGTIRIEGRDPRDPRARAEVALVPQVHAVWDELTVQEHLELALRLHGKTIDASHVREHLADLELEPLSKRRVGTLSGGWRRRVSFAMGTVVAPKLLLLDEPAEGVDEASAARMTETLVRLRERGVTLVVVSHRGVELTALHARVMRLEAGRLAPAGGRLAFDPPSTGAA